MSQIDRCLDVLELLHQMPQDFSLRQLDEQLDMPKSALHRMLSALREHGYVEQDAGTGNYRATLKLSLIGARFFSSTKLRDFVQPAITDLGDRVGELVRLSLLVGDELTWVLSAQGGDHTLRYDGHSGRRVVPHVTATGRVWLASMSEDRALEIARAAGFDPATGASPSGHGPQTEAELLQVIARTRDDGYGMVVEEAEVGVSSVACPIWDYEAPENLVGVVSCAGPSARLTTERMISLVPQIQKTAIELSRIFFKQRVYSFSGAPQTVQDTGLSIG